MYLISLSILPYKLYLVFWPILSYEFFTLRSIKLNILLQNEFPAAILELPKLKILDEISNTNLIGSFLKFHNNLLEHVDLAYTSFFGVVPESISNLSHLKCMYKVKGTNSWQDKQHPMICEVKSIFEYWICLLIWVEPFLLFRQLKQFAVGFEYETKWLSWHDDECIYL